MVVFRPLEGHRMGVVADYYLAVGVEVALFASVDDGL